MNRDQSHSLKLFYFVGALFIILNSIALVFEFYWFYALPVALLILYWSFFSVENLMLFVVFSTPLAVNLEGSDFRLALSLPTEPLLFGIMLLFIVKVCYEGGIEREIYRHPITKAVLFYLLWMTITTLTSEKPLVSVKYLVARLWFISTFYFMAIYLFRSYSNIRRFIWLYSLPLVGVIGYTLVRHVQFDLTKKAADWVMSPFYNDHTAYAAAIAMFIPFMIAFWTDSKKRGLRILAFTVLGIFVVAMILSYSRAAWLSLAVALAVFLLIFFRVRMSLIFTGAAFLAVLFFLNQTRIMMMLEKNKQDASTNYTEHIRSISNISTDASNLERLNRWNSAFRMFEQRPFFGWGPGTYAFLYAPFQHSNEKTIISTNMGDGGNAHSEYIGPLAEQGVLGAVSILVIAALVIYKGIQLYKKALSRTVKITALAAMLGLITYFVHGIFNNFLDTDKASVPFWGFVSILTVLDLYSTQKLKES